MEIVGCPDPGCRVPAEVVDRWQWPSTDGPVEHVLTRCVARHCFTVPVERIVEDRWVEHGVGNPMAGTG